MNKKKFTLLELMIVIAIIAILISILLPSLGNARRSAKNAVCKSNLAQISRGATLFAKQNDNKFWDRRKDIKGTHIGREYNNGEHEFNLYNDFISRDLYSCPLAPEAIDFDYIEQLNPRRTEAQYLLLWNLREDPSYGAMSFKNLYQDSFNYKVNYVSEKSFGVLAMDYVSEKQSKWEASHENGKANEFPDENQFYGRRGGNGGRTVLWMTNYTFIDGSAVGVRNIKWLDPRFDWVHVVNGTGSNPFKAPMPEKL